MVSSTKIGTTRLVSEKTKTRIDTSKNKKVAIVDNTPKKSALHPDWDNSLMDKLGLID
jgi:hypothetical protein